MSEQENLAKITTGFRAVARRDFETLLNVMEPDFTLELILKPEELLPFGIKSGREAVLGFINMLFSALPDLTMEQTAIRARGDTVYQELTIYGTHQEIMELPNGLKIPATHLRIKLPVEITHTFDEAGRLISSRGYAYLRDIVRQFNLRDLTDLDAPGGS